MTNLTCDSLIIFTRFPRPGKTKTRLAQVLGDEAAADCQRRMTGHIVSQGRELARQRAVDLQIHYDGATAVEMAAWLGDDLSCCSQVAGDLGQRMAASFAQGFDAGKSKIVLVGADCPGVSTAILTAAFDALAQADLVLGPALDGGYYLIGMRRPHPELFAGIDWGTARVLAQTIAGATRQKLIIRQLTSLHDIDRPEDLEYFGTIQPKLINCPKL
jgi:rSAM/selenodomain-associated transferase 1